MDARELYRQLENIGMEQADTESEDSDPIMKPVTGFDQLLIAQYGMAGMYTPQSGERFENPCP